MATMASEHLALINAVITKRLSGDGWESYTISQRQFRGTPLMELYALRDKLAAEAAADGGSTFFLAEPGEF